MQNPYSTSINLSPSRKPETSSSWRFHFEFEPQKSLPEDSKLFAAGQLVTTLFEDTFPPGTNKKKTVAT